MPFTPSSDASTTRRRIDAGAGRVVRIGAADHVLQERGVGDRAREGTDLVSDDANAINPYRDTRRKTAFPHDAAEARLPNRSAVSEPGPARESGGDRHGGSAARSARILVGSEVLDGPNAECSVDGDPSRTRRSVVFAVTTAPSASEALDAVAEYGGA